MLVTDGARIWSWVYLELFFLSLPLPLLINISGLLHAPSWTGKCLYSSYLSQEALFFAITSNSSS